MSRIKPAQESLKPALKAALTEVLHEQRELLHEVFAEVIEDFAMARAIRKGQNSKPISRAAVMRTLKAKS